MQILEKFIEKNTPFVNFVKQSYVDMMGQQKDWYYAERRNQQAAVVIVAMVRRHFFAEKRLAVIREFRIPTKNYQWGFPAGLVEARCSVHQAVGMELEQETGLQVKRFIKFSPLVYSSAGITDEAITLVFVEAQGVLSVKKLGASEEIEPHLMNRKEVKKLLQNPEAKFDAKAWLVLNNFAYHGRVI